MARHPNLVACRGCDLLQRLPSIPAGGRARCGRCGEVIARQPSDPIERPLALTVAALILFILANSTPLMGISAVGRQAGTTILGGAIAMWIQGQPITAALVLFCVVIAPAGYLLFMLTILLAARRPPAPVWVGGLLRWSEHLQAWSMLEVMLLGILVALVKIAQLAVVEPGIGLYATGALLVLLTSIVASFDPHAIWEQIPWTAGEAPAPTHSVESPT